MTQSPETWYFHGISLQSPLLGSTGNHPLESYPNGLFQKFQSLSHPGLAVLRNRLPSSQRGPTLPSPSAPTFTICFSFPPFLFSGSERGNTSQIPTYPFGLPHRICGSGNAESTLQLKLEVAWNKAKLQTLKKNVRKILGILIVKCRKSIWYLKAQGCTEEPSNQLDPSGSK